MYAALGDSQGRVVYLGEAKFGEAPDFGSGDCGFEPHPPSMFQYEQGLCV